MDNAVAISAEDREVMFGIHLYSAALWERAQWNEVMRLDITFPAFAIDRLEVEAAALTGVAVEILCGLC